MNFLYRRRKSQSGFTLIELLVVIAIIGILSSVVLAALNSARVRARDAKRIAEIRSINNAIQLYIADYGTAPTYSTCNIGASCVSNDRNTNDWKDLANKLKPYISLPSDPCGAACDAAPYYYSYQYVSPGAGINPIDGYQIYATDLETTQKPSGVNTTTGLFQAFVPASAPSA